jgi:hypothetical protein
MGIQATLTMTGAELAFGTSFATSWQLAVHRSNGAVIQGEGDDDEASVVRVVGTMAAATSQASDWETLSAVREKLTTQLVRHLDTINFSTSCVGVATTGQGQSLDISSVAGPNVGADADTAQAPSPSRAVRDHRQSAAPADAWRVRDPVLDERAKALNLNLQAFEGRGLEQQAVAQLNAMVENCKSTPFLDIVRAGGQVGVGAIDDAVVGAGAVETMLTVHELFRQGAALSEKSWQAMVGRPDQGRYDESIDDLKRPPTKLPMNLHAAGLEKGIDLFEGPHGDGDGDGDADRVAPASSLAGQMESLLNKNTPPRPTELENDERQLSLLVNELVRIDPDMRGEVLTSYRDVLLCDNLLFMLSRAKETCVDEVERAMLGLVSEGATAATLELGLLVKTESVRHLQTIHDVCDIAFALQQDEDAFMERMDLVKVCQWSTKTDFTPSRLLY